MIVPARIVFATWNDEPVTRPAKYLIEGPATYGPDRPTHEDFEEMERHKMGDEYELCRSARKTLLGGAAAA